MAEELFLLPFDHRHTFVYELLGFDRINTPEQADQVRALKQIIYEGFQKARDQQPEKSSFGILVDEEFGAGIIADAQAKQIVTAVAVEKSGLDVFDFEYGDKFREHIEHVNPSFVKVLVRYNPENSDANEQQLTRLAQLSQYCLESGRKFLFELLVPPTKKDLERCGSQVRYYTTLRIERTVEALQEIQCVVRSDIWKLEGCEVDQWPQILSVVNPPAKIIVLGHGADGAQVIRWLVAGAKHSRIEGFAVGRTVFMEPLKQFVLHRLDRDGAIEAIAKEFTRFASFWIDERKRDGQG